MHYNLAFKFLCGFIIFISAKKTFKNATAPRVEKYINKGGDSNE